MADIFAKKKRSEIMSHIRSCDTKPERRLYEIVRSALGSRWRIDRNVRSLPGQPDVLVTSLKLAILADGCFFHGCPVHGRKPDTRRDYWLPKLERNVRRDHTNRRRLRRMGYAVWRFWEHDLKGTAAEHTFKTVKRRIERLKALRERRALGGS